MIWGGDFNTIHKTIIHDWYAKRQQQVELINKTRFQWEALRSSLHKWIFSMTLHCRCSPSRAISTLLSVFNRMASLFSCLKILSNDCARLIRSLALSQREPRALTDWKSLESSTYNAVKWRLRRITRVLHIWTGTVVRSMLRCSFDLLRWIYSKLTGNALYTQLYWHAAKRWGI